MSAAADGLPPLHQAWMDALVGEHVPGEAKATCHDCVMLPRPGRALPLAFHPHVKCCTYHPALPNFLVGLILREAATAQQLLDQRIAARVGVTPHGIAAPAEYRLIHEAAVKRAGVFGRVPRLRCPFYVEAGGSCGIWRQRNATCATWFCTHEHAARGKLFWELTRRLFTLVEKKLVLWTLLQLPVGDDCFEYLISLDPAQRSIDEHDLNRSVNEQLYRVAWGNYVGRERQLFLECAELVERLSWRDVLEIGGVEVAAAAQLVRHAWLTRDQWPERVVRGPAQGQLVAGDQLRVSAAYDSFDVPVAAVTLLPRLEGQALRPALKILADEGQSLDDALVQKLLDFQLLVPAD